MVGSTERTKTARPPGALDGLLLDITGWTADEVQTGVAR